MAGRQGCQHRLLLSCNSIFSIICVGWTQQQQPHIALAASTKLIIYCQGFKVDFGSMLEICVEHCITNRRMQLPAKQTNNLLF